MKYSEYFQILGFAILYSLFNLYVEDSKGEIYTEKIIKGASISKDKYGFPNIIADKLEDGSFALGYAHAEDRLWQMYLGYKLPLGEISEVFGEKGVEFDEFMKLLNFYDICQNTLKHLTENERRVVQSYTDGINYYIENTKVLPLEFILTGQPKFKWKNEYTCLAIKMVEYYLSTDFLKETIREYLVNRGVMTKDVIEKLFPYGYDSFESHATIIKNNEAQELRKNKNEQNIDKKNNLNDKNENIDKTEKIEYEKIVKNENKKNDKNENEKVDNNEIIDNKEKINEKFDDNEKITVNNESFKPKKKKKKRKKMTINNARQDIHGGSNNYVFSGKITEDGNPIIGNDPHLHNSMPGFWYVVNMRIKEGNYHFVGVTHPGSPILFIGQNGYVGWGITIGFADIADFLKLDRKIIDYNDLSFTINNKKHYLKKRIVKIYLDVKHKKYTNAIYYDSEIGPVINGYENNLFELANINPIDDILSDKDGYFYILKASFTNKFDNNFKAMMFFNYAKDVYDFTNLISNASMSLNLVYADTKGNIAYHLTGKIPIRKYKGDGAYPKLLESEEDFNNNYIPFNELPHLINPERGYIITCNNLIISDNYKYILQGGLVSDQRFRNLDKSIKTHLDNNKKINIKFIKEKIINNVYDVTCEDLIKTLIISYERDPTENKLVLKAFKNFDCNMEGDSYQALLYNVYISELLNNLNYYDSRKGTFRELDELSMDAEERGNYLIYKLRQYRENDTLCLFEYNKTCISFFNHIYDKSTKFIRDRLGDNKNNWKWKNLNKKLYSHLPFSQVPGLNILFERIVKTNGNLWTPKTAGNHINDKKFESFLSSNLKFVSNLNNKNEFYISIDCGNNGKLFNEHYDDLCINHENGELINYKYSEMEKPKLKFLKK